LLRYIIILKCLHIYDFFCINRLKTCSNPNINLYISLYWSCIFSKQLSYLFTITINFYFTFLQPDKDVSYLLCYLELNYKLFFYFLLLYFLEATLERVNEIFSISLKLFQIVPSYSRNNFKSLTVTYKSSTYLTIFTYLVI